MVHFDRLTDFHTWHSDWKVSVKIVRKWNKREANVSTVELIIADVFGDKMQVTISENLVAQFCVRRRIEEDEWKTISNFAQENDTSAVKVVDTNYGIKFTADTIVENIDGLSNNHFIDYHNFDKIYDGWSAFNRNCCLDTMREVSDVEPTIFVDDPATPRFAEKSRMTRFSLRNLEGHILKCVAYNEAADNFNNEFLASHRQTSCCGVAFLEG
ncbi:PREDICTED: uncharacterized protein LOC104707659 [Camelina sativa]|uniref:Uncharacterized protein LOC104707659 n=1 Tax=Camelina sativa TaxID=90675 RepID=A0ABM0T886_CAMSA|nr:PREDICTED: uncharacterized protein LOC104707659 [Camelina sativa]